MELVFYIHLTLKYQLMIMYIISFPGVVTKPDLIDPGTESELLAVLNNERFRLEKGYTCVKCRGQKKLDDKQSLAEAIAEEEKFFQRNQYFRCLFCNIYLIILHEFFLIHLLAWDGRLWNAVGVCIGCWGLRLRPLVCQTFL